MGKKGEEEDEYDDAAYTRLPERRSDRLIFRPPMDTPLLRVVPSIPPSIRRFVRFYISTGEDRGRMPPDTRTTIDGYDEDHDDDDDEAYDDGDGDNNNNRKGVYV